MHLLQQEREENQNAIIRSVMLHILIWGELRHNVPILNFVFTKVRRQKSYIYRSDFQELRIYNFLYIGKN